MIGLCSFFISATMYVFAIAAGLMFLVATPMMIIKKSRHVGGITMSVLSFGLFICAWMSGFVDVYAIWGPLGIIIGCFAFVVGIIGEGLIATLLRGMWGDFFIILGFCIFGYIGMIIGSKVADSTEKKTKDIDVSITP